MYTALPLLSASLTEIGRFACGSLPVFRMCTTTASPFLSLRVEVASTLTSGFSFFTTTPLPDEIRPFEFFFSSALFDCVDSQPATSRASSTAHASSLIRSRH